MLIVGFGKLARMVTSVNKDVETFYVYNRTKEKVVEAKKKNRNIHIVTPDQFSSFQHIFLALPPDGLITFFQQYGAFFQENSLFFHTATGLTKEEVETYLPGHRVIPLKYAGHALQAMRENNGNTFVIPPGYEKERQIIEHWLGSAFSVVTGTEEEVLVANQVAVEETMKLVAQVTERLDERKIPKSIQEAALSHIPAGVIHAHLAGEHGAFAKKILEQWQKEKRDET